MPWAILLGVRLGDILQPTLWLVGALLVGIIILAFLRSQQQRAAVTRDPVHEQLAHFRELYQRGQMSREEYQRVYTLLAGRIRGQVGPPADAEGLIEIELATDEDSTEAAGPADNTNGDPTRTPPTDGKPLA
jgi:hypothetical protein